MGAVLHVATYNIHKGLSLFNRRLIIHDLRDRLRALGADLVFLQEVQVLHEQRQRLRRFDNWPSTPQYQFLADSVWHDFAYGRNAIYDHGHHGNAILSRFPIVRWENEDVSAHRFESRGLLHCEVQVPGWDETLHCVCVHLALTVGGRRRQLWALRERIERMVPANAPLVVAGDFNDWRDDAAANLARPLGMHEVFEQVKGEHARSFPAAMPLLRLDRIYVRGFSVRAARVHHSKRMSDHAALTSTIVRL
jgi:endonuclease/exonuclease/phosphatase family metal-dependent hydrolase